MYKNKGNDSMRCVRLKHIIIFSIIIALMGLIVVSCVNFNKNKIRIAYVSWNENVCLTGLVKYILEEKKNYEVETIELGIDEVFSSLANNKSDIFLDCWLPVTHEKYISQYGGDLENLGYIYEGARMGLAVPYYVSIDNIEQLNEYKDQFKRKITAIEADSGLVNTTMKAINVYGLDYEIEAQDNQIMLEKLRKAIDNKEWIVVTSWNPNWELTELNLKYLYDSKYIYGSIENIHAITRKNFSKEYKEVAEFIYKLEISKDKMNELLMAYNDNSNINCDSIREFVERNSTMIDEWLSN